MHVSIYGAKYLYSEKEMLYLSEDSVLPISQ